MVELFMYDTKFRYTPDEIAHYHILCTMLDENLMEPQFSDPGYWRHLASVEGEEVKAYCIEIAERLENDMQRGECL